MINAKCDAKLILYGKQCQPDTNLSAIIIISRHDGDAMYNNIFVMYFWIRPQHHILMYFQWLPYGTL